MLWTKLYRVDCGKTSIHIPFDIFNVCRVNNGSHHLFNSIDNIFSCIIKDILLPRFSSLSSWHTNHPIWMKLVEIRFFINHFWLKPNTKFHAKSIDLIHKFFQCATQFFLIDMPIAKTTTVIISLTKPAIIKNQHLNAKA